MLQVGNLVDHPKVFYFYQLNLNFEIYSEIDLYESPSRKEAC